MSEYDLIYTPHERLSGRPAGLAVHFREMPNQEAKFAMALIERFALVAAETDGEDTAGRQKLRRMTPDEMASFACDVAASSFDAFRERGWMIGLPDHETIVERAREQSERN